MGIAKSGVGGGRAIKAVESKWEPPSNMSLNLKKHKSMDNAADVGKTVHFQGHGKVSSIRKDEMGHQMGIDIDHIEPADAK